MSSEKPRAGSRRNVFLQGASWVIVLLSLAGALALAQPLPAPSPIVTPPPAPVPTPQPMTPTPTPASSALVVRGADVDFPTPADARADEPLVKFGRPAPRTNYGTAGNREAARLRSMSPEPFDYDRSVLRDVLRSLATQAGIPYVGIPEHSREAQHLVTFKMTASPFAALESLARQNDIKLTYEDGVWFMNFRRAERRRIEDENELIGVIYHLKHDPSDNIGFRSRGGGGRGGQTGGSGEGGGNIGGGGGNTGEGEFGTPDLPLQISQFVFDGTKIPVIVNQVRLMLGLKPLTVDSNGNLQDPDAGGGVILDGVQALEAPADTASSSAGGAQSGGTQAAAGSAASLGSFLPLIPGIPVGPSGPDSPGGGGGGLTQPSSLFPVYVPPQKPQVIYNSDSNILWVVATRKQQRWVAEYLQKVDKPQDLIAIEVKFFETNKNPQTAFGINWEKTFGGEGLGFNARAQMNPSGVIRNGSATFAAPYSAVLSMDQASVAIQAFASDREGSFVQYPRVLTINNREVAITSAENTPVNAGVQNVSGDNVGGQNVGTLEYLPTGTQINILPKAVGRDQIALTVAVTISSIVAEKEIDLGTGVNTYPVTASRVYNASLQVNSGYTLAVGGLEKTTDLRSSGGIPLLKDIPGVGYLFKNKGRDRARSNLIIFITPYVIDDPSRTPGISEKPESTLPVRRGAPPPAPTFSPDGRLIGGEGAVASALGWGEYQLRYFRQINTESRDDEKTITELRAVIERVRALSGYLQGRVLDSAGFAPANLLDDSARADTLLVELNKVLAAAQLDQFQLREGIP